MWKHKNFINLQLHAGETWVLNETVALPSGNMSAEFQSNNQYFSTIGTGIMYSKNYLSYINEDNDDTFVYRENTNTWVNEDGTDTTAYRTIVFDAPVTDTTLLTWLQANGTKQSTPQPTLTFKHFYDAGTIGSGTVKFRHYSQTEPTPSGYTDCITFTGETSDFTLAIGSNGAKEWDGIVEYSTDHNTWTTWNGTAVSSVNKKLYLRGSGNTKFCTRKGAQLSLSARAACSGNIQTLLEYSNPPTTLVAICYYNMFKGCTGLTAAPALPATTLADSCYSNMFYGCTNLAAAPELPATTLANGCYSQMFDGCTGLTAAPALPATTLADSCYFYMFYGCSNLAAAPELPATTLANYCYSNMFRNCTGLTAAPELPATILAKGCYTYLFSGCRSLKISSTKSTEYPTDWRIPSSGTISTTEQGWNSYMLQNTGGTFTSDPSINTTYYGAW